ncbi:MAG: hypothetical protein RLN72_01370 [Henriciella sp.]
MIRLVSALSLAAILAACGDGPADPANEPTQSEVPSIGADMAMPTDKPFCVFVREDHTGPLMGEGVGYVLVTELGEGSYHGYATLDGAVTKMTEIEAGFGAGIETRRYETPDAGRELEVILLEQNPDTNDPPQYTGSIRQIFPVEGEAVKFRGECQMADGPPNTELNE